MELGSPYDGLRIARLVRIYSIWQMHSLAQVIVNILLAALDESALWDSREAVDRPDSSIEQRDVQDVPREELPRVVMAESVYNRCHG
jgi:hypothetical protein